MSSLPPVTRPDVILEVASGSQLLVKVIAATWIFYDYLLTISDEIELLWRKKLNFRQLIVFYVRYSTIIVTLVSLVPNWKLDLSALTCSAIDWCISINSCIALVCVQILLVDRIHVLYFHNRVLLTINIILMVLEVGAAAGILMTVGNEKSTFPAINGVVGACFGLRPAIFGLMMVPPLVYELYLAVLAARKAIELARHEHRGIAFVLVEGNLLYFVFLSSCLLANLVVSIVKPISPGASAIGFVDASGMIGCSRLTFSIQRALRESPDLATVHQSRDIAKTKRSKIEFAQRTSSMTGTTTYGASEDVEMNGSP